MIRRNLFLSVVALIAFAACEKPVADDQPTEGNGLPWYEAPESIYAGAAVEAPVTKELNARLDQKYRPVKVALADLGVTPAEGAVFYAHHDAENDWCGKDWYTSENGFYIDAKGFACSRSKADARFFVEYYPETGIIGIGQLPDVCKQGEVYTFEVGFATEAVKNPIKFTVNVLEALPWATSKEHEDGLTYTVYETVDNNYTALQIPVNETAVITALGLDSMRPLKRAMASDVAHAEVMLGVNASDGSYDTFDKYTANTGYWYNRNGDVCEWNTENYGAFVEWDYNVDPMTIRLGQAPGNNVVGDRYDLEIALRYEDKEARLKFKLKIVEEVTDDLGLL